MTSELSILIMIVTFVTLIAYIFGIKPNKEKIFFAIVIFVFLQGYLYYEYVYCKTIEQFQIEFNSTK